MTTTAWTLSTPNVSAESLYVAACLQAQLYYEKFKNLDVFTYYLAIAASSLLLILLFTGGSGNSGIVWLPAWPILIYSILPVKTATFINLGLYSFIIVCRSNQLAN